VWRTGKSCVNLLMLDARSLRCDACRGCNPTGERAPLERFDPPYGFCSVDLSAGELEATASTLVSGARIIVARIPEYAFKQPSTRSRKQTE
jgi:hypothetical protein